MILILIMNDELEINNYNSMSVENSTCICYYVVET